jgi:predicted dehydrogenase
VNALLKPAATRPRIGFLGVGWIGRMRLQALVADGSAEIAAIADPHLDSLQIAAACAPGARTGDCLDYLLGQDVDGIVIATPSALHAQQTHMALQSGLAVLCQKPLTCTASEAEAVIAAARRNGRLLGVDFSYRYVAGVRELRDRIQSGELGQLYAIDLVFHNAYGPDKPWFYEVRQSGGGCAMDLGSHLVDLALWMSGSDGFASLDAQLYTQGRRLEPPYETAEDYATMQASLIEGTSVRMSCSWHLPAGREALIEASFYGTRGGASLRNVAGSFYDFRVERYNGTQSECLARPPDAWGGRALVQWAQRVGAGEGFDAAEAAHLLQVARTVDRIYAR